MGPDLVGKGDCQMTMPVLFRVALATFLALAPLGAQHSAGGVRRVFSDSPPVTYMIYALDPSLLVGLNFPVSDQAKPFLKKEFCTLPILGGFFGQGQTADLEAVLKARPQLVCTWTTGKSSSPSFFFVQKLKRMGMPIQEFRFESLRDDPGALRALGTRLGRKARAEQLSRYGQESLAEVDALVKRIPQTQRTKVYYAEGPDGLSSECSNSMHAELISLAGGVNMLRCQTGNRFGMGMEKVSLEQIYQENPDVILVQDRTFYNQIFQDRKWQHLKAVKTGRVHLIPRLPFNWFDRPPSIMRFLGLRWLAQVLYPDRYRIDLPGEMRRFYRLFLWLDLTDADIKEILSK